MNQGYKCSFIFTLYSILEEPYSLRLGNAHVSRGFMVRTCFDFTASPHHGNPQYTKCYFFFKITSLCGHTEAYVWHTSSSHL